VYKLGYRLGEPLHGDIIVFRAERKADTREPKQENVLIKRLVGLPGDKIEVKPDATGVVRVYRNGEQLVEPYTKEPMNDTRDGRFGVTRPIVLGRDELFVMGDNRNNSNDSRYWGPLPRDRVIGQAVLTFWPLNRLRWLK
jgi:signal peptidase I